MKCLAIDQKFKFFKFTDIDMAALSYIIFASECKSSWGFDLGYFFFDRHQTKFLGERFVTAATYLETERNLVFKEIYEYYTMSYGTESGGLKFAHLLNLLNELLVNWIVSKAISPLLDMLLRHLRRSKTSINFLGRLLRHLGGRRKIRSYFQHS